MTSPGHDYEHGELVSLEQSRDPLWFKRVVFYEVLIRGFADSNGDGTGDIRGLTGKLDYLQWLGIDCVWHRARAAAVRPAPASGSPPAATPDRCCSVRPAPRPHRH